MSYITGKFNDLAIGMTDYLGPKYAGKAQKLIENYLDPQSFLGRSEFQKLLFPILWAYLLAKEKASLSDPITDNELAERLKKELIAIIYNYDYTGIQSYLSRKCIELIPLVDFTVFCVWVENEFDFKILEEN